MKTSAPRDVMLPRAGETWLDRREPERSLKPNNIEAVRWDGGKVIVTVCRMVDLTVFERELIGFLKRYTRASEGQGKDATNAA